MGEYDLKRLDVAIQYIQRMVSGRNPVTNRPAPENEILTNPNVHRCLQFVCEILTDVKNAGGTVGNMPKKAREPKEPRPSIAEIFPYEILTGFRYEQDQQISYFLKQIAGLLPEETAFGVQATLITDWLRENDFLTKTFIKEFSKEVTVPTKKGSELGIYTEKAGFFPNEYYRIYYNEKAQLFIIRNFRRILTESSASREQRRLQRREQRKEQRKQEREQKRVGLPVEEIEMPQGFTDGSSFEEDPGFLSLLSNMPSDLSYENMPSGPSFTAAHSGSSYYEAAPSGDPYGTPQNAGTAAGIDAGFNYSLPEEGWENSDDGIPW